MRTCICFRRFEQSAQATAFQIALARAQLSVPTSTVRRARLYGNSNKKVGKPAIGGIEEVLTVIFQRPHLCAIWRKDGHPQNGFETVRDVRVVPRELSPDRASC